MYIGPVEPRNSSAWLIQQRRIMEKQQLLSPGFVQIYNEILVNAIDRQFHSNLTEIRVEVDDKAGNVSIWNDGGAIPVKIHTESGLYVPAMVFGEFMSGENFDDSGAVRFTGGRNGIGAKATNVFSTAFEVTVDDPSTGWRFFQRWEDNMAKIVAQEISPLPRDISKGSVWVSFQPDLKRFGLKKINKAHLEMMRSRAFDAAACTNENVSVRFNGALLQVQSFQEFADMALGEAAVMEVKDTQGRVRAEVAVGFSEQEGYSALGFVNGIRCSRGTHVKEVVDQITQGIGNLIVATGHARPTDATVKQYLRVVVKVLVDNPDFDSQTKTRLTTTRGKLGFHLIFPQSFFDEVAELGVLDAAVSAMEAKRHKVMRRALASGARPSIAKLEDATFAGKKGHHCTLILTEGDSAKALAVAGLAKVGREHFGVFPLKGKLLNVRSATDKQIQQNEEIKHLMHILGLRWGQRFQDASEVENLRYQQVMIFSDQDLDGHHIAGLIINLLSTEWPSLLEVQPQFIQRFATPLVKATSGKTVLEFFTEGDFRRWAREQEGNYRAKYYKGLGTSTREEALQYFGDMEKHVITVNFEGEDGMEAVEKAFEPDRSDDRKLWIQQHDAEQELNYSLSSASFRQFFDLSFLHFSAYNCHRAIPLLMDGLKPSQRKVLWWAMKNLRTEKKVSQIVGLVSSATSYHHGEESLVKIIVNLAQDFVGTNNLNLLQPIGMFGTRLNGRDVHASARYIHTKLSPLVSHIFLKEDLELLPPQLEEGQEIEPHMLLPIFPLVLVNGFQGIGTGWSTTAPNYDVLEVIDHLAELIEGRSGEPLLPHFRGFRGRVERKDQRFISHGQWQILEDDELDEGLLVVEITELPVKAWTEDYMEFLEKKATGQHLAMKVYKCSDHNDQNVHLLLAFERARFSNPEQELARFLRLQKPILSQMWLYSEADSQKPELQYFQEASDVMETFHRWRLPFYGLRKERMMEKLSSQVKMLTNQVRWIEMCKQEQGTSLSNVGPCYLKAEGFDALGSKEDGFHYILNMPMRSFSDGSAEQLREKLVEATAELERVQGLGVEKMWLEDLARFRTEYLKAEGTLPAAPSLTSEDRIKALQLFNQERRKWYSREEEDLSVSALQKKTNEALKELCERFGIDLRNSKRKQDFINQLLLYQSIGFVAQNWEKLPVGDLRAYCLARGVPEVGDKDMLVERLSRTSSQVPFRRVMKDMKQECREMGLSTSGNVDDICARFTTLQQCREEEAQALRNLAPQQLRRMHRRALSENVFRQLTHCFTVARCANLEQAKSRPRDFRLTKLENCWVNCIVKASRDGRGPEFYDTVARCFSEDCGTQGAE